MALGTKVIVLSWWSFETHMNPNQKEVVHRRLAPHLYEETNAIPHGNVGFLHFF